MHAEVAGIPRRSRPLDLTDDEEVELRRLAEQATLSHIRLLASIVLAFAEGASAEEVPRSCLVAGSTANGW